MRPNVLLIVLDTARADVFEPYGAPPGATPTVAQLASRGSALTAYSTANWTVPSHASMFTGLMPRDLGLTQVAGGDRTRCRAPLAASAGSNVVKTLQDAGWATRGVSANPWISADSGFGVGFDELAGVVSMRRPRMHDASIKGRLRWALDGVLAGADHGARQVEQVIDGWIADVDTKRPFFWFVNLLECHSPYLPPRPYNDLPPWRRAQVAEEARKYLNLDSVFRICSGNMSVPAPALERMGHLYRRAITFMDDWLARVLTALDRARLLDDTQVVVTSDHGENLGESGLIGHAFSLDDRLLRIPFVTAGPLDLATAPLSLAGVPRRLAEALGLADHPWQEDRDEVLVAQHDGVTTPDSPQMQDAARRWGLSADSVHRLARSLTAASDTRWKLVVEHDGWERVFDLAADPLEQRPLPVDAAPVDVVARLRKAVDTALIGVEPAAPTDVPVGAPAEDTDVAALEEQMRLLGYL